MRITFLLVLFISVAGTCASAILAADPPEVSREVFDQLLMGFKQERDRLLTGSFNARGKIVTESAARGRRETKLDLYYAFDFKKEFLRFDYFESPIENGGGDPAQQGGRLILTREARTFHNVHSPEKVTIRAASERAPPQVKPFDLRVLGIGRSRTIAMNDPFAKVFETLQSRSVKEVTEESPGLYRIVLFLGEPAELRETIWLDTKQGHSPIRSEFQQRKRPAEEPTWRVVFSTELTWTKIADVWVPATVVLQESFSTTVRRELTLDWKTVNQQLPDGIFSVDDFALRRGDRIVDMRGPEPVIEYIGKPR